MSRTLCIGDIHGGLKALQQIWETAGVKVDDTIIFLGDYVDGWAQSFELIEHLIELDKTHKCIFIKGNHDVWCRDWLFSGLVPTLGVGTTWKNVGGQSTLNSYRESRLTHIEPHRAFFNRLHHYYEHQNKEGKNVLFVHGGYTQEGGVRMELQRNLWWDRSLLDMAYNHENKFQKGVKEYQKNYPRLLKVYDEIFVGHTTTQMFDTLQPMQVCNLINLDTGGGHRHGRLTIMDIETKEYWQSDKLKELYPDDPQNDFMPFSGRNLE